MDYIQVFAERISQTMSMSDAYILILSAREQRKEVPILIGEAEAQAILLAVEGRSARRPLTHNLLSSILDEYMLNLKRVTIDRFDEGIFYSSMYLYDGFSEKCFDCRTSDAVVMSLLQGCGIYMNSNVFEETSMEQGALEGNLPGNHHPVTHPADTLAALEEMLRECEENEDYEQAAESLKRIEQIKNSL